LFNNNNKDVKNNPTLIIDAFDPNQEKSPLKSDNLSNELNAMLTLGGLNGFNSKKLIDDDLQNDKEM